MIFRLVCRAYFDREEFRLKLPPELNNCPAECPESPRYFDAARRKFCESCPHKLERDNLKEVAEDSIFQTLGRLDERHPFEKVLPVVYQVGGLQELSPNVMTVKTAEMVSVYQSEKHRAEAIKEADRREQ